MNKYEAVIIIDSDLTEESSKEVISKFEEIINNNGNVTRVDDIGIKKLAYKINNRDKGHYVLYEFEADSEFISELQRVFRITEEVLKYITIRKDD